MPKDLSNEPPSQAHSSKCFAWRCHDCGRRHPASFCSHGTCQASIEECAPEEESTEKILMDLALYVGPFCVIFTRSLEK